MTHMICCATPSALSRGQTKATLDLANLAKGIKSVPRSNRFVTRKEVQRQLTKTNKRITEVNLALIEAKEDVAVIKARLLSLLAKVSGAEQARLLRSHPVINDLDKMGNQSSSVGSAKALVQASPRTCHFVRLPDHVLLQIFSFCDARSLGKLMQTDRRAWHVARSNFLWVPLFQASHGSEKGVHDSPTSVVAAAAEASSAWIDRGNEEERDPLDVERHTAAYRMYKEQEMQKGRNAKKKGSVFKARSPGYFVLRSGVASS